MEKLPHPTFSTLTPSTTSDTAGVWEGSLPVAGGSVSVSFFVEAATAPDAGRLGEFAQVCERLTELDQTARQTLRAVFAMDPQYARFHLANGLEIPGLTHLRDGDLSDAVLDTLVAALSLVNLSLWFQDQEESPLVLDYRFAGQTSEDVLALRADLDGAFHDVSWEG